MIFNQYKKGISVVIALSFALSLFAVPVQSAHAFTNVNVVSTILLPTAITTAGSVSSLLIKETVTDPLAYALAKTLAGSLMNSLINWIQSGFEGNPVFVTDLNGFFASVDARVFEEFIGSDAIELLCSPWKAEIRRAITYDFSIAGLGIASPRPVCSLDDVVGNIDQFIDGDFGQGGWAGWFELTQRSNPYRDYLITTDNLNVRREAAFFEEREILRYGSGFFSREDCESLANSVGIAVETCSITTPGAIIEQQLEHVLGSELRQLEIADELSEVLAALFSSLINNALSGTRGLLGI